MRLTVSVLWVLMIITVPGGAYQRNVVSPDKKKVAQLYEVYKKGAQQVQIFAHLRLVKPIKKELGAIEDSFLPSWDQSSTFLVYLSDSRLPPHKTQIVIVNQYGNVITKAIAQKLGKIEGRFSQLFLLSGGRLLLSFSLERKQYKERAWQYILITKSKGRALDRLFYTSLKEQPTYKELGSGRFEIKTRVDRTVFDEEGNLVNEQFLGEM